MAKPFDVPWTINDEDESGFAMWYLTRSEYGLAIVSIFLWYLLLLPLFAPLAWRWATAAHLGVVGVMFFWFITWMSSYRRGKPTSWLWDTLMAIGFFTGRRGLIGARGGLRWFSMQHVPRPATFLSGAKKTGEDLTVSAPWMQLMPPVIEWSPLIPPRRKRVFGTGQSPAPAWFHGANGFATVVNPRIPLTISYIVVPDEIPAELRDVGTSSVEAA